MPLAPVVSTEELLVPAAFGGRQAAGERVGGIGQVQTAGDDRTRRCRPLPPLSVRRVSAELVQGAAGTGQRRAKDHGLSVRVDIVSLVGRGGAESAGIVVRVDGRSIAACRR